jgi:hypothetical protein
MSLDEGKRSERRNSVPSSDLPHGDSLRPSDSMSGMDMDDRPPICPRCGVTMVPAALSADDKHEGDWVCLECEELDEGE